MKSAFNILIVLAIAFGFPTTTHSQTVTKTPCPFPVPADQDIQCGYLSVPQNRADPHGRMIQVAYALVKSHSPRPAPHPIVLLNGGPGGPMRFLVQGIANYNILLASRDMIFFDPRGVDHSVPNLDCRELEEPFRRAAVGQDVLVEDWLKISDACKRKWASQGIDLAQYNSINTALDVRDLWHALGYEKVNLLSLSYGTVLAQILLREAPQDLRAVVLDSPLPLDTQVEAEVPARAAEVLSNLFEKCARDLSCRAAYPDLRLAYQTVRDQTLVQPVLLTAKNPQTGEPFNFSFTADDFGVLILGTPRTLPASMYDLRDGNFDSIIQGREALLKNLDQFGWGHAFGLSTTVFCTEEMFHVIPGTRSASSLPEARLLADETQEAYCQGWVNAPRQPLLPLATADVPTLIFAGEYDTRLPPAYAQRIADSLPNAQSILFPGMGHVVYQTSPCAFALLAGFIVDPSMPLDTTCVEAGSAAMLDTPFLLRASFAEPFAQRTILIFSIIIMAAVLFGGWQISRQRFGIAWKMSWKRTGWLAPILTVTLTLFSAILSYFNLPNISSDLATTFTRVVALAAGIQSALLFAPDDESAFEIQLAAPRPLAWSILERVGVLLAQQTGLGIMFSLVFKAPVIDWFAPMILFAAIGMAISIAARRSTVGLLFVVLIWFASLTVTDALIQRLPILWVAHPFLETTSRQYALNRWLVLLCGIFLMITTAIFPRREEILLFGGISKGRGLGRTRPKPMVSSPITDAIPTSALQIRLAQFAALVRTELILQWRKHSLGTTAFALITLPVIGAWVSKGSYQSYKTIIALGGLSAETAISEVTFQMYPYLIVAGVLVYVLMLPIVTADVIPADSQVRVREIINSLPVPRMTYLLGKVLAIWAGILMISIAQLILCGAAWWVLVAPFDMIKVMELWFALLWMGLVNTATVMLLTSQLPARRSVLIGMLYAFLSIISMGAGIFLRGRLLSAILPGRPAIMLYYIFVLFIGRLPNTNISPEVLAQYATHADIYYAALAGLAQVLLIIFIVWLQQRKEDG